MKRLATVADELREQVEEATDPKDPNRLPEYSRALRDGIEALISSLSDDPTLAALAFHGQIKFTDSAVLVKIADDIFLTEKQAAVRCKPMPEISTHWTTIKKAIQMRPEAHKAIKILETAGLEAVLVAVVVANFKLTQTRRVERETQEEKEEQNYVE